MTIPHVPKNSQAKCRNFWGLKPVHSIFFFGCAMLGLGLQAGDVISRYAGEKITRNARLVELTSQTKTPAIPLTILRAGKAITLTAQPGKLGVQLE